MSGPDASAPLAVDRLLGGRYRLIGPIARGGMAEVWEGYDDVLSRPVAVKVLLNHLANDPMVRERFRREAVTAAGLAHPNIVATYDTGLDAGVAYIVMELIRGRTLRQLLAERGALPVPVAVAIADQIASALVSAHRAQLVHRDIKPANVLLADGDGPVPQVKVTDFGIAKIAESVGLDLTSTGMVLGTPKYLSPEQVEGREPDARADLYALGVVLFEMLTGGAPFVGSTDMATALAHLRDQAPPVSSRRQGIPPSLDHVVAVLLAKEPADRYSSADELRRALAAVGPLPAPGPSGTEPTRIFASPRSGRPTAATPAAGATPATGATPAGGPIPATGAIPAAGAPTARGPEVVGPPGVGGPPSPVGSSLLGTPSSVGGAPTGAGRPVPSTDATAVAAIAGPIGAPGTYGGAGGETARVAPATGATAARQTTLQPAAAPTGSHRTSQWATQLPEPGAPSAEAAETAAPRRRRRRRGPGILVAALVVAGVAVAAVLVGRTSGTGDGAAATGAALGLRSARVFVLHGRTPDDAAGAVNVLDGNPATVWATDTYANAHFGNLYPGIGLAVELDGTHTLHRLDVSALTSGWTAQAYVAGAYPGGATSVGVWGHPTSSVTAAGASTSLSLGGRAGLWVLLWLTSTGGPPYRVQIGDLTVR